ncbi:MAG: transposase [Sphingomonas bacterium]
MSDLYWLTDEQMARLEPYFPKSHGRPRADGRRVLNGLIFVNRNGLRWREAGRVLPIEAGPRQAGLKKARERLEALQRESENEWDCAR